MGPLIKYTNRLILRVENESKAKQVLDLYLRNRLPFEQYEPTRPASFYTQDYHWSSLHREYIAYTMGTFLRYYIYLKDRPDKIIGAINFNIFAPPANHTRRSATKSTPSIRTAASHMKPAKRRSMYLNMTTRFTASMPASTRKILRPSHSRRSLASVHYSLSRKVQTS